MGIEVKVESNVGKVLDALPEQIAQALEAIGIAAESNAVKEVNKAVYDTSAREMKIDAAATTYGQTFADMYNYAIDWTLSRAAWLSEQFSQDY